jgi:hypothetical protein
MEIYPTCLRQSGLAAGTIVANTLAVFGPYIVYLGTEYDVRYPYVVLGKWLKHNTAIKSCSSLALSMNTK